MIARIASALTALLLVASAASAESLSGRSAAGIYYEVSGAGEPVVLIHGFSLDRRIWEPQIAALEGRFRIIRYDLRGHGRSDPPNAPYAAIDDLRSVLDSLGIARATLIGHSAGGEISIDFALTYPERVARLVLAAPGLSGYTPSPPLTWTTPVFQAAGADDVERATTLWLETPIMRLAGNLDAQATVSRIVRDNSSLWSIRANPARALAPPAIGRLGDIRCPVLVVVGDQDLPHLRDIVMLLAKGIRGARAVEIPHAGHLVTVDAAPAFNEAVDRFLGQR